MRRIQYSLLCAVCVCFLSATEMLRYMTPSLQRVVSGAFTALVTEHDEHDHEIDRSLMTSLFRISQLLQGKFPDEIIGIVIEYCIFLLAAQLVERIANDKREAATFLKKQSEASQEYIANRITIERTPSECRRLAETRMILAGEMTVCEDLPLPVAFHKLDFTKRENLGVLHAWTSKRQMSHGHFHIVPLVTL